MMDSEFLKRATEVLEAAGPVLRRAFEQAVQWVTANKAQTTWGAVAAALLFLNMKRFPLIWHVSRRLNWNHKQYFEHILTRNYYRRVYFARFGGQRSTTSGLHQVRSSGL